MNDPHAWFEAWPGASLGAWLGAPACAVRVALGLLLLRACCGKARDLPGFVATVRGYRLLPDPVAPSAASALVAGELVVAGLLLCGLQTALAGLAAAMLFVLFAGAMAINLLRGRAGISCGCLPGAASRQLLSWGAVSATASLAPLALLAGAPWPDAGAFGTMQAVLAGLLLFTLHDAALRLAATPRAGARS